MLMKFCILDRIIIVTCIRLKNEYCDGSLFIVKFSIIFFSYKLFVRIFKRIFSHSYCNWRNMNKNVLHSAESTPGFHIIGGVLQPEIRSAIACIQQCQVDYRRCAGVDFNTNGNTCWFHSAATECNQQLPLETSTHYRCIDACDVSE